MAKFTEGPWMQKKHDGAGRTFELKREFWEVGGGPDKAGVAFVFKGQANASLIAAAPEMYEALQDAIRWLDGMYADSIEFAMDSMPNNCMSRSEMRKVIAKADGTENGE